KKIENWLDYEENSIYDDYYNNDEHSRKMGQTVEYSLITIRYYYKQ
ncbi:8514_t:CDS:1, partial [Gigaspora rosea]